MKRIPLSERLRPKSFKEIVGQEHLLGPKGFITYLVKKKRPLSIILWGPPGTGKTSIARIYAQAFSLPFESISPIFSGITDLKRLLQEYENQTFVLFVDEIHRFNKAQQDAFLPALENGNLILVGSTVENPSFYLIQALLSRTQVLKLNILDNRSLEKIIRRYENQISPLKQLTQAGRKFLIRQAHGDGRYLLNMVEVIEKSNVTLNIRNLELLLQKKAPLFDKDTDQHYNLISALHKSVRGSDPNAALYWFARMILGGEEPLYISRRLIRMASEDIGLADPHALSFAIAARDAYEMLGSPEGELALAQVVLYLSLAPKSNSVYLALGRAEQAAAETNQFSPPAIILNAPTSLMRKMGFGRGYIYDHDTSSGFSGQNYFPPEMERLFFYAPVERGFEREMKKRLDYYNKLRRKEQL
jgi:putative ATPase